MDSKDAFPQPSPFLRAAPPVPWGAREVLLGVLAAGLGILALNGGVLAINHLAHFSFRDHSNALMLFVIAQDAILFGAAAGFSVVRSRGGWSLLGLRRFNVRLGCGLSIALLFASYAVRACYAFAALALGAQLQSQSIVPRLDVSGVGFALTFFAAAIVAPIVEEIFFRGFVYAGLRARWGVAGALLLSAVFFTALHFTLDLFVPIFILGVFLAWVYEKTGSLYPGILLHASNNAIALVTLWAIRATGVAPL